jgi:hypothetical protein
MLRRLVVVLVPALAFAPNVARAEPLDVATCTSAYQQGQRLRRQGTLLESREQLFLCARDPCPASLQPDCLRWLGEVEHLIPSIVIVVRRDDGSDVKDAHVTIDGHAHADRVDGLASEVNPGEHAIRVEVGAVVLEQVVLTHVAEKGRIVTFHLPAPRPPPPPAPVVVKLEPHRPVGWPTFVLGGLGVVGLGIFGGFAIQGESRYADLRDCRPACNPDDVDAARSSYRTSDIALALSLVALAGAAVTFLTRPTVLSPAASPR